VGRNDKEHEASPAAPTTASAMVTPLDIQQKEFQVSRFGGYRMRDVDEFLDQLTDAMQAVLAENERLRSGAGASPIVGSPDLDEVSRQADEIIQRARNEAARIVADANDRVTAGGSSVAAGTLTSVDRAAVDAFLARERAFLQRLASLVQEHADGLKGMAREVRRTGSGAGAAAGAGAGVAASAGITASAASEHPPSTAPAASSPERRPEAPAERADTPTDPEATRPIDAVAADEPIVVDEPEPARSRRDDGAGDETLRELFWGEEG
jgi:DivIVA domain-containing protein